MTIQTEQAPIETQSESIKLVKNTKGYGWELKILNTDIDRIEKLNNEMLKRFGSPEE